MLNRLLTASRHGLGLTLAAMACFEDEDLSIIELDGNLADAEKPPVLPAGLYVGEIQDIQKQTSGKGNEYFNIKFVIPTEEISAELADQFEDGAALYYNRILVPKPKDKRALYNLRKFIEAIGLDSNTTTINPNEWMGCRARLKIKNTTWEGEPRAEIAGVEAAEAPAQKPKAAAKEDKKPARGRR
jgi:hypothetical protein